MNCNPDAERKAISSDASLLAVGTYKVHQTNWPADSQQYIKPHIITALDTESVIDACVSIKNAYISRGGRDVSVIITECYNPWAIKIRYHYDATYKNSKGLFYILIFSSF